MSALLDTSILIAREQDRPLASIPTEASISVVTLAELHLGVLAARTEEIAASRARTVRQVERLFEVWPVDEEVAVAFATVVAAARAAGRRPKPLDALIAATAVAHDLDLYTQDTDFEGLVGVRAVIV